ncbi:hypothetical protein D3C71_2233760 [compost metagenome]
MLAPHVDKLFDRGWISFEDDGSVLMAAEAKAVLAAWGLDDLRNVGKFRNDQKPFLEHHRINVYKG